jgi:hypothetical protein
LLCRSASVVLARESVWGLWRRRRARRGRKDEQEDEGEGGRREQGALRKR